MLQVVNNLCSSGKITLALVRPIGELIPHIDSRVEIVDLGGTLGWVTALIRLVWQKRPRTILSTLSDINIAILLLRPLFPSEVRIVVREALMPDGWMQYWRFPRLTRFLYRYTYLQADRIIVLSETMRRSFLGFVNRSSRNLAVIPNAVDPARLDSVNKTPIQAPAPYLIAVGRLHPQKGFDALIEAFSLLGASLAGYRLLIIGEGSERSKLELLIERLGLSDRVILMGFMENPTELVRRAVLFVLSSRVEGSSNALIEALSVGTPVLAVKADTGADELIVEGKNGFLIGRCETQILAQGIKHALANVAQLNRKAIETHARERFSLTAMIDNYREVLFGLAGTGAHTWSK